MRLSPTPEDSMKTAIWKLPVNDLLMSPTLSLGFFAANRSAAHRLKHLAAR